MLCVFGYVDDLSITMWLIIINVVLKFVIVIRFLGRMMINFWRLGEILRQGFHGLMPSWSRFGFSHPFPNNAIMNGGIALKFLVTNQIHYDAFIRFLILKKHLKQFFCCSYANGVGCIIWHDILLLVF